MDIVIIGANKAGTTWLFSMLKQHPKIGFAFAKEIHYFDNIYNNLFKFDDYRNSIINKEKLNSINNLNYRNYINNIFYLSPSFDDNWYKNIFLMKPENQVKIKNGIKLRFIEATPSYMIMSERAVAHMAHALPDVEPILIVRDPVRRMVSGTCMRIARTPDRQAVTEAWITRIINEGQVPRGSYSVAISKYRKYFKNLHIIPFNRIPTDPLSVLREIEQKYNLDNINYIELKEKKYSYSNKMELSNTVLSHIKSVCEIEYEYLNSEFGSDFLNEI